MRPQNVSEDVDSVVARDERCSSCGGSGRPFRNSLHDREFGVPGEFSLLKCPDCGLVWLEDMPAENDVGAFYANYYTHAAPPELSGAASTRRRIVRRVWPVTAAQRVRRAEMYRFFVPDSGGRILEAGCGSGANLAALRKRGWEVVGQDIDPLSAESARAVYGVDVRVGSLDEVDLDAGSFDAILMNHVVEHLREPERDLRRCRSLLKPGGRLVIITPNISSLGARVFRRRWRGLEPPRHLYLYNVDTLGSLLHRTGFTDADVQSRGARTEMVAFESMQSWLRSWRRSPRYVAAKVVSLIAQLAADVMAVDRRGAGDELVAIAHRV